MADFKQYGCDEVEDLNSGRDDYCCAPGSLSLAERQPGKLVS